MVQPRRHLNCEAGICKRDHCNHFARNVTTVYVNVRVNNLVAVGDCSEQLAKNPTG